MGDLIMCTTSSLPGEGGDYSVPSHLTKTKSAKDNGQSLHGDTHTELLPWKNSFQMRYKFWVTHVESLAMMLENSMLNIA